MFASLIMEEKSKVGALPVVCEFPCVFPDDILDLPPEREIEFAIDVVP
ncbi:enzymatic polyprotein, partial [Trifolium medium]|nr:enzymatic polyprotein [Trifolium medium]